MPITAICLLRLDAKSASSLTNATAPRIEALEDGLLVHTGLDFAEEPEALSAAVRAQLGDALLDQHGDPRGLFFLPDVAAPRARDYAGVVAEVGEGGVWAPLRVSPPSDAGGMAGVNMDMEALLGGVLGQIPSDVLASAAASAAANPEALMAASRELQGLLRDPNALEAQVPGLGAMLRGSGIDFESPALQRMAAGLQAELARDPQRLADLAEQLFGAAAGQTEDEEDEDGED